MTFARVMFLVAGAWGIVVLTPLYFLVDLRGRQYAARGLSVPGAVRRGRAFGVLEDDHPEPEGHEAVPR
jgi:hypothetical protein